MSDLDYLKMVEVPVDSCSVVVKPKRRKKKDAKEELIEMVNDDVLVNSTVKRKPFLPFSLYKKKPRKQKPIKVSEIDGETVSVKSSKFDIVSAQVVAIFALVVGIILTNVFIEDSGMNNLLKSVFGTQSEVISTAEFSSFSAVIPSKTGNVTLNNGVMTIDKGSVYAPCDGVVEKIETVNGKYDVTVRHSNSFTTLLTGLELCYALEGDNVYSSVAIGYSGESIEVSMFNGNSLLTEYSILNDEIVWQA